MRIASLLPSATDALHALGLMGTLAGRSHACDAPGSAELPVLTSPGPTSTGSGSLYRPDTDALLALAPDVVLTDGDADDIEMVRLTAERCGARVVELSPTTVEGVLDDLLTIADAAGEPGVATGVLGSLRERLWRAQEHVNPYASDAGVVGFMEWTDPIRVAGHWTVQMIERAGGTHPWNETAPRRESGAAAGPQQGERVAGRSIAVTEEVFAAFNPRHIVIAPRGRSLAQARAEAGTLLTKPWFAGLEAVRDGRVAVVEGNRSFHRPGPTLVDAFEFLVGYLNGRPELIPADFLWQPLR